MDKLTHITAPDMFAANLVQVFDAKSGKWIATIPEGTELKTKAEEAQTVGQEVVNKNQLTLF